MRVPQAIAVAVCQIFRLLGLLSLNYTRLLETSQCWSSTPTFNPASHLRWTRSRHYFVSLEFDAPLRQSACTLFTGCPLRYSETEPGASHIACDHCGLIHSGASLVCFM